MQTTKPLHTGKPSTSSLRKHYDDNDEEIEHREHHSDEGSGSGSAQSPLDKQRAMKAALEKDPGVPRFSWSAWQVRVLRNQLRLSLAVDSRRLSVLLGCCRCIWSRWLRAVVQATADLTEPYVF